MRIPHRIFSGKNVNPQIVENYRGGDIALGIGDEVYRQ